MAVEDKVFPSIDLRAKDAFSSFIACSDGQQVLDFAYNPIDFHMLTTCGADGSVRVWDLRNTDKCALQIQQGHSYNGSCALAEGAGHSVSKIRYNPAFDQLILTGGTSTFVSLFRAPKFFCHRCRRLPLLAAI